MSQPRTPQTEPEHHQAFELFASLGERRTYRGVASQLGVSERTIRHWARQGNWKQLLREREVEGARRLADQTLESTVTQRSRNRKIVEMALVRLAKAVAEGKVRMQLGDIERLIRLQADLDRMDVAGFEGRNPKEIMASFFRWYGTLDRETRQWAVDSLRGRVTPGPGLPPRA
jgi:transposase